jgi:hypothetical protein
VVKGDLRDGVHRNPDVDGRPEWFIGRLAHGENISASSPEDEQFVGPLRCATVARRQTGDPPAGRLTR